MNTEQFKKDWIVSLLSTSGIMLTICLMVLTILWTTSSTISGWQRMLLSLFIVISSTFLMFSGLQSLRALGTLILTSIHYERGKKENAKEAAKKTGDRAQSAEHFFEIGLCFLIFAILASFLFLNWSFFIIRH